MLIMNFDGDDGDVVDYGHFRLVLAYFEDVGLDNNDCTSTSKLAQCRRSAVHGDVVLLGLFAFAMVCVFL